MVVLKTLWEGIMMQKLDFFQQCPGTGQEAQIKTQGIPPKHKHFFWPHWQ